MHHDIRITVLGAVNPKTIIATLQDATDMILLRPVVTTNKKVVLVGETSTELDLLKADVLSALAGLVDPSHIEVRDLG